MYYNILFDIFSGILFGRWGLVVYTDLGRSQVEVQRCILSWADPTLGLAVYIELGRSQVRSSGGHWAGKLAKRVSKTEA